MPLPSSITCIRLYNFSVGDARIPRSPLPDDSYILHSSRLCRLLKEKGTRRSPRSSGIFVSDSTRIFGNAPRNSKFVIISPGLGFAVARFISGPLHYRIAHRGTMERDTTQDRWEAAIRSISEKPAASGRSVRMPIAPTCRQRSPMDIHEEADRVLSDRIVSRNAGAE